MERTVFSMLTKFREISQINDKVQTNWNKKPKITAEETIGQLNPTS
jgi:hypothetical protein